MNHSEKQTFEYVLRDMREGLLVVGLDGRILICNPSIQALFERGEAQLTGRSIAELMAETDA